MGSAKLMIGRKDREILRELAKHQLELANSLKNMERVALWKKHNICKGERPVIHIEVGTFQHEVIEPRLKCTNKIARAIEYQLYNNFINFELFDDDRVVPNFFPVQKDFYFSLFNIIVKESVMKNEDGIEQGHNFVHPIKDFAQDYSKLQKTSRYTTLSVYNNRKFAFLDDLFGDILPVRLVMSSLYAVPTQKVVHLMGMEPMFFAMYDHPEKFKEMMDRIANDYVAYFKHLEKKGELLSNTGFENLAQGSMCFWDEEPKNDKILLSDVWGFMDSQETVGVSPDMFKEFIFPCYEKIGSLFGRLSYGCCEPVSAVWDDIKTLKNLKKVSISPWCDEVFMGEQLRGTDIVYHRKPSPNFLGVGTTLDEDAFRAHIETTLNAAAGCTLEITQRDVYTVNNDIEKVQRYVQIIRESIDNLWQS